MGSVVPRNAGNRPRICPTRGAMTTMTTTRRGLETHQTPATPEGIPRPDPDSRIQESGGAFLQGYNARGGREI